MKAGQAKCNKILPNGEIMATLVSKRVMGLHSVPESDAIQGQEYHKVAQGGSVGQHRHVTGHAGNSAPCKLLFFFRVATCLV